LSATHLRPMADVLVRVGLVRTMDPARPEARALAVRGSRVLATAVDPHGLDHLIGPGTLVRDAPEVTVLPAFDDTHTHLMFGARAVHDVPLADARTVQDVVAQIRARARMVPAGEWIRTAANWHELNLAERRLPTAQELDQATTDHPVLVKRGGHNGVVNSTALRLCGITADTPDMPGGVLVKDAAGRLTGHVQDAALDVVERHLPSPDLEALADGLALASAEFAAHGIGTVRDCAVTPPDWAALRAAAGHGTLAVRVRALAMTGFAGIEGGFDEYLDGLEAQGMRPDAGDDWCRLWGLKMVMDGGVENGALDEGYAGRPDFRGELFWDPARMAEAIGVAVRRGWRVGTHAFGDRAITAVLDAYETVLERHPGLPLGTLVLEHGGLARPGQRARAIRLGIPVTVQHPLLSSLAPALCQEWGQERTADIFPLRSWLAEGATLAAGSDYPIGGYDAMAGVHGMVTRTTAAGVLGPEHAISRAEAVRLHTADAARLLGESDRRGTLTPGHYADLVGYGVDPLTCPVDELLGLRPEFTVVGGRVMHGCPELRNRIPAGV
jgi:predicted amidohydrolase YtcJ